MPTKTPAYEAGFEAALEKLGATRGLKEIRKSFQAGDMGRANRLAKTPGVLSPTNQLGSEIKDLGRGGEGLATMVAHPQHGIAVRKTFDPAGGAYSPQFVKRKEELANLPGVAKVLGATQGPRGTPIHFNEPIQGRPIQSGDMEAFIQARHNLQREGLKRDYHLADLRPDNAMVEKSTGKVKFIDHAPMKPHEVVPNHQSLPLNQIPVSPASKLPLFGKTLASMESTPAHLQSPRAGVETGMLPAKFRHERLRARQALNTGAFKAHYLGGKDTTAPKEQPISEVFRKAYPHAAPPSPGEVRPKTKAIPPADSQAKTIPPGGQPPPLSEQPPPLESSLFSQSSQPPPLESSLFSRTSLMGGSPAVSGAPAQSLSPAAQPSAVTALHRPPQR